MDPRLLSLYEQELRYFRDSSGEFAKAFPKIANRLGMEGHETVSYTHLDVYKRQVFSMELKEARIKAFAMLGGGALPGSGAMDVLEVVFGAIAIEAAPQSRTGQRGGVRSFSDSVG